MFVGVTFWQGHHCIADDRLDKSHSLLRHFVFLLAFYRINGREMSHTLYGFQTVHSFH